MQGSYHCTTLVCRRKLRQPARRDTYNVLYLRELWQFAVVVLTSIQWKAAENASYAILWPLKMSLLRCKIQKWQDVCRQSCYRSLRTLKYISLPKSHTGRSRKGEAKGGLETAGENYPAHETFYETPEKLQNMIEATLNVHNENRLHRIVDDDVEKKFSIYSRRNTKRP